MERLSRFGTSRCGSSGITSSASESSSSEALERNGPIVQRSLDSALHALTRPRTTDRLVEIRDNLLARIAEAQREGWLGAVERLRVSLAEAQDKLAQLDQRPTSRHVVDLGIPTITGLNAVPHTPSAERTTPTMRPAPVEVPLTGGRITPGVVRVADTVRRPATASSAFVAQLLTHLERRQFAGAPRYLGRDEAGRDIFSYLSGWVADRFQPWSDAQVASAGALLRSLHDATRDSALTGEHPVVCHHDPGPNNTVFRAGLPVAFIDFDTAAPGDPLEDIGYMAWTWCISSKTTAPPATAQAAQVRILADAYGLTVARRADVPDAILDRQSRNARWWAERLTDPGNCPAGPEQITSRIAWSEREHAYTSTNRLVFAAALR